MLWGSHAGELELRRTSSGVRLRGRFPYGKTAVLSDGGRTGRPRKEVIMPNAFAFRVNDPEADIHLLLGHSYDAPLASKLTRSLVLEDTAEALSFEATITREVADTTYGADVLKLIEAGLVKGLSPGFRLPPERRVKIAEELEEEELDPANGKYRAIIRRVREALLFELSVVTAPAYDQAQVEMRSWDLTNPLEDHLQRTLARWRA